jgi:phage shock protein C
LTDGGDESVNGDEEDSTMEVRKSLRRSRSNRMIGGVVGGIAEYLGMDPNLARVLYVLISVVSAAFPGILVYLILWILIPDA